MKKSLTPSAILLVSALIGLKPVFAGPISYQGGWMLSTDNEPDFIDWQLSYSLKPWISIGADYAYDKMDGPHTSAKNYGLSRVNFLLKRWNNPDSQGNIYIYGGAGAVQLGKESSFAWNYGAEADWESRSYYVSARAQFMDSNQFDMQGYSQARIGVAPYVAPFDGFHSWVILQAQYWPNAYQEKWRVGPLMRFFVQNVLWELSLIHI